MTEVKGEVSNEVEGSNETENYKKIKPEGEVNKGECDSFWKSAMKENIVPSEKNENKAECDSFWESGMKENDSSSEKNEDIEESTQDEISVSETDSKDKEESDNEIKEEGVTEGKRAELKNKGISDEVIDQMSSDKEACVYEQADLIEGEVNGKKCLQKKDIDPELKDEFGKTNRERIEMGRPPIDKNGEIIELHHVGQKADSPLAELSTTEHRGKGNYGILHDTTKDSEIHTPENEAKWKKEREEYWKERAKDFKY